MPRQLGSPPGVAHRAFGIADVRVDREDPAGGLERHEIVGNRGERDVEMGHRRGVLAPSREDQAEVPVRFGHTRIHGERPLEDRLGPHGVVRGEQHPGEAEPRLDERRVELDGAAVVAFRFQAHPDPFLDETQVVVGGGVVVVEAERPAQRALRLLPLPLREERDTEVRVGPRVLGIDFDGAPVAGLGGFGIAVLPVGETEVMVELRALRDQGGEVLVALLERRGGRAAFEAEEHRQRQEEEAGPLEGVLGEPRTRRRFHRCRSGRPPDPERRARLRLANLPDEAVEVEVEHGRGGHQREDAALHRRVRRPPRE